MKTLALILLLIAIPLSAQEDKLTQYMMSRINSSAQAFSKTEAEITSLHPDEPWSFERFYLIIAPKASFGVRDVAEIEISPTISFIWEKSEF